MLSHDDSHLTATIINLTATIIHNLTSLMRSLLSLQNKKDIMEEFIHISLHQTFTTHSHNQMTLFSMETATWTWQLWPTKVSSINELQDKSVLHSA